jgi:hypothetical protein
VRPWLSGGTIQLGSGDPRDAQQPNTTTLYSEDTTYKQTWIYMAIRLAMSVVRRPPVPCIVTAILIF